MGGCCSKCGNYLLGTPQGEAQGGDTPKLSRLQHKESFNGPQKVLTNGHENGDVKTAPDAGDATPKKGDPRDRQVVTLCTQNQVFKLFLQKVLNFLFVTNAVAQKQKTNV